VSVRLFARPWFGRRVTGDASATILEVSTATGPGGWDAETSFWLRWRFGSVRLEETVD
jgi:hypothetical protein